MITVANPIYDSVFKFLMQDTKVAKTLLKNLLGCEIEELILKNNEFVFYQIDDLKLSRLDFSARIKDENGETKLITIELQKAFLKSEVMRFRRYIGEQYINPENCIKKVLNPKEVEQGLEKERIEEKPIPIIAIYLLGHKLEHINTAIAKTRIDFVDNNGNSLKDFEKDDFYKGLIHNLIIVQIPLLPSKPKPHVERILSIFNHSEMFEQEKQLIQIEDLDDLEDYKIIARRLALAAVDKEVRKRMKMEDDAKHELDLWKEEYEMRIKNAEYQIAQEREKAYLEKLAIAKSMLADGVPISTISKYTGLSQKEIDNM